MAKIKQTCGCVVFTGKDLPVYCDAHRPRLRFSPGQPDPAARITELEKRVKELEEEQDALLAEVVTAHSAARQRCSCKWCHHVRTVGYYPIRATPVEED
jgi:hypothetical protein